MRARTTFPEIINNRINIPLIQRDYVQGLGIAKNERVRQKLVEDIIYSLSSSKPSPHDLGMIYGAIANKEFQPFDGQQRLTTMWLFSLYTVGSLKYLGDVLANNEFVEKLKTNFKYQIRNTTIDFTKLLVDILVGEKNKSFFEYSENKS